MMTHKGPSRMQLRIGAAMATVMVSGGLLLTASGGIAAETSRKVEKRVQTVMVRNGIVTERAATPAEIAAADRAESAAWHARRHAANAERIAHAAPPQPPEPPEATAAPEPPVPSQPAAPPAPPSEMDREVAQAMQEARRDVAAAQLEAAAEIRAATIERMHDQAEARATMIEALTSAREELAREGVETAGRRARMVALASLDRQLAALKAR